MQRFMDKFGDKITGVLSGFDRLIFRGGIRGLMYQAGMGAYLNTKKILLKDFKEHAFQLTTELKQKIEQYATDRGRPFLYLPGHNQSKEQTARDLAQEDNIKQGLVCVLSVLEPCQSYKVVGNRSTQKLELKSTFTKCLHLYFYWIDPIFGLMHGRIQTWYPFNIQIYINGKEWLGNMMSKEGITFKKNDNCFTWVEDVSKASLLAANQIDTCWPKVLDVVSENINPILQRISSPGHAYYWTLHQSEWATDILFENQQCLDKIYPQLIHHSMVTFNSKDVLRFLGKRLTIHDEMRSNFGGEVTSDLKTRPEGIRVKHVLNANSVKIYNKAGSVLRVETTINRPSEFKVYREVADSNEKEWQTMRKSVVDIARRAEVSQKTNERHLDALGSANVDEKLFSFARDIFFPIKKDNLSIRGLDPLGKDGDLIHAIGNGEFLINGFRNRDIRGLLFPNIEQDEIKKHSAKVSRMLKMLREHGIIKKVPKTHRYQLATKGIKLISAMKTITDTRLSDIQKKAA